jgi:hypothetical protein
MGINTAAGTTLYIGTTATDPLTDTFTVVGQVSNIPEFGRIYNEVKFNPLSTRGTLKVKGSYDDGSLPVELAKDSADPGQVLLLAASNTDFDYNFKVVANDAIPATVNAAISITVANPGVVTWTAHGFAAGTAIKFTAGTLPTGLTLNTTYYVCSGATLLTNTFTVAATYAAAIAGTGITTTGWAGSGITGTTVPAGTIQNFKAKVLSYTTNYGTIDNVIMSKAGLSIKSGSLTEIPHLP